MGILDFLFGRTKSSANRFEPEIAQRSNPKPTSEKGISYIGRFASIPSIDFYGLFKKSPSGEWVICWCDSDARGGRGGYRASGHGRYILYNTKLNAVVSQGALERPNSADVADNGVFSIEDWHFGDALTGTFYVFSATGQELIKRRFGANLFNSALSVNGRYAICQTCNAPSGLDGNRLTAFDVGKGVELFSINPPTGWASHYGFDEAMPQFEVIIKDIGGFVYDEQGAFLDAEKFATARLNCDRFDVVLYAAEDIINGPDLNDQLALVALEAATRARLLGADKDQGWKALALKIQGLAHEFLGSNADALVAFEEALKIDPKIGVKRKAASLRKKMGGE